MASRIAQVGEQMAVFERDAQVKDTQRLQAVRIAQFDKEQKVGEQTAMFEREAMVKEAEQKKRVAVANADARAISGEAESQASIADTQSQLAIRQIDAYQLSETKKREAEAAVVEAGYRAQTRAAIAREAFQLLMVDQIPLLAESAAKAISNIKFDKVVVWEGGNASGPNGTAGFIQNMARSMPPMMDVLRTVAGVELPAFLGTMAQDAPAAEKDDAAQPNPLVPVSADARMNPPKAK